MASKGTPIQRMEISYFEGVNAFVDAHVAKKYEFRHIENARSSIIGSIEKREGTTTLGSVLTPLNNLGLFYFENTNADSNGLYRACRMTALGGAVYYYNKTTGQWVSVRTGLSYEDGTTPLPFDATVAEGVLFITNRLDKIWYISSNGTTVNTDATLPVYQNHVYRAPKAGKINYYKDRLYVGDYYYGASGSVRVPNGIGFSSYPIGLISIVTQDRMIGDPAPNDLHVTDTTYVFGTGPDILEVYRGGALKGEIEITGKTEDILTTTMLTAFDIYASDELWIKGTYGDQKKVFRWPDVFGGKSPTQQKEYDTFKLSGEQNGRITMLTNVGDVMVYANRENMGIWNNSYAKSLDLGIGCCSDYGYVKALGTLWFIDYNGIYATTGGMPALKSSKVEPYIKGATRAGLEAAAAGKKGYSVFWAIGDVTLYNDDGSVMRKISKVVLEYNMRQENWYVHTGIDAQQFANYRGTDEAGLLAYTDGGTAGRRTYDFLSRGRSMDATPTGDKEIQFRVDTSDITLSSYFERISYPKEIVAEVTRGSAMQTFISLDNAPFYQLSGDLAKGCTIVQTERRDGNIETEPRCRQLKVSIRDYTNKPCKLSRMAINYIETAEEETQRLSQVESVNL